MNVTLSFIIVRLLLRNTDLKEFFKPGEAQPTPLHFPRRAVILSLLLPVVSLESRAMHLNTLVQEAQDRVSELSAQVENEGFTLDNTEKEKQLKAWEWRYRLYRRMKTGFEHAREYVQEAGGCVMRLSFGLRQTGLLLISFFNSPAVGDCCQPVWGQSSGRL